MADVPDERWTVLEGDCVEQMRAMPEASVDAICTDPPYGLGFMGKEWDTIGDTGRGARARVERAAEVTPNGQGHTTSAGPYLASGVDSLRSAGRPFQAWCEAWAREALRVLKPGGHLLAFGGTRTYHRLAAGIEDAGFEIRDTLAWMYGQGFPKSLDVSKAIDKRRNDAAEIDRVREWLEQRRVTSGMSRSEVAIALGLSTNGGGPVSKWTTNATTKAVPSWENWLALKALLGFGDEMDTEVQRLNGLKGQASEEWMSRPLAQHDGRPGMAHSWRDGEGWTGATARGGPPVREDAQAWEGWGTGLKPGYEPIVVARKPLSGTVASTVLEHGTGALNIDATRIAGTKPVMQRTGTVVAANAMAGESTGATSTGEVTTEGRWPGNVVLSHTEACVPVGTRRVKSNAPARYAEDGTGATNAIYGKGAGNKAPGDARSGYASADGMETITAWECVPGCPVRMLDEQTGTLTSGPESQHGHRRNADPEARRTTYGGFQGQRATGVLYGDSGGASRFFFVARTHTIEGCEPAITAAESSSLDGAPPGSVPGDAATSGHREGTSSSDSTARSTSGTPSASRSDSESATSATPSTDVAPSHERPRDVPTQTASHASPAAPSGPTGTTTTTTSPSTSDGSVGPAMSASTPPIEGHGEAASRFRYVPKASSAERAAGLPEHLTASHPTVKPIELMRWLIRLVTPRGGTCLDPFLGSGTTGCAAVLEGVSFIGIEREAEYVPIAEARIRWWAEHPEGVELVKRLEAERERAAVRDAGQDALF